MVKINSTSGLGDMRLSDFHHKQQVTTPPGTTLVASLVKIDGGLQSVERSIRFV